MDSDRIAAYFSMEIALDDGIPTYSGGLGVLAGDMLRSAADGGYPLVAVTLVYHRGYFRQQVDGDGRQSALPDGWQPASRLQPTHLRTTVTIEGRPVHVAAWRTTVDGVSGSDVPVFLLDTDLPENDPIDRRWTDELYGGDRRYRLAQEIILGLGGKAIVDAATHGTVELYHLNEGHSALVVAALVAQHHGNMPAVRGACVFTTHTPVPAGHDRFARELVEQMVDPSTLRTLVGMGQLDRGELNMTELALAGAGRANAVAMRHAEVSQAMFPGYAIEAITNGVHLRTWIAAPLAELYDRHLAGWQSDNFRLRHAVGLPLDELRAAHRRAKEELAAAIAARDGVAFDPDAFTLGFARRAATYKRADLLFSDLERLEHIAQTRGPLQLVFGGKAHPQDEFGQALIARVFDAMKRLPKSIRAVYLENYDMALAKQFIPGVDCWLNTPRRPEEASGTSGMKAAANGVPSLSTLDGWWVEGYLPNTTGWAIGGLHDPAETDADALYATLEQAVLPLYYDAPDRYAEMMRGAIAFNASHFNTERMMHEYWNGPYRGNERVRAQNDVISARVA